MSIFTSNGYLRLDNGQNGLLGRSKSPRVAGRSTSTPFLCLATVYVLNIIGWGAMDFFLVCNAAPAMCHPTCDDPNSPRRRWIEIDTQILVALLCIPAFGLAPWRYRDLYVLLMYRVTGDGGWLVKLVAYNEDWVQLDGKLEDNLRLEKFEPTSGSEENSQFLEPASDNPVEAPSTSPTKLWKLDVVVCCKALNTAFQAALAGFMWGYNRFDRPPWSASLLVPCAFGCMIIAKLAMFLEGTRIRNNELVNDGSGC